MGENQNIEYKQNWSKNHLRWVCGLANAHGGKMYIGCDDKGDVVGVKDSKHLLEEIPNTIKNALGIFCDVNLYTEGDNDYIEICVPQYSVPICYEGQYFRRVGATNLLLTGQELNYFLMGKNGMTWDYAPLPRFTIDDVDDAALEYFKDLAVKKARIEPSALDESKEVFLDRLHLVKDSYLTNAAMLLFSKDPERWQAGAFIKVAYFEGPDIIFMDEVHGPLMEQVEKTKELVYWKYLKAKITYEGMQRIERYFVPEEAFREALINAICHKQYESGIPIQISVYDDKVYIGNPANLPEELTLDNLMGKHSSIPYNPKIAHVFYLAGLIESWGRGIEKICGLCQDDGVYPPQYSTFRNSLMIEFSAPEERIVRLVPSNPSERMGRQLDEISCKILDLLAIDPAYNYTEIAEKLSLARSSVARYFSELKNKGIVERVGSNKKGYWKVKKG